MPAFQLRRGGEALLGVGKIEVGERFAAAQSEVGDNEVFVMRKEAGTWKIHRYPFATSQPAG